MTPDIDNVLAIAENALRKADEYLAHVDLMRLTRIRRSDIDETKRQDFSDAYHQATNAIKKYRKQQTKKGIEMSAGLKTLFRIDYTFNGKKFHWYMDQPTEQESVDIFRRRIQPSVRICRVRCVRLNRTRQIANYFRIG